VAAKKGRSKKDRGDGPADAPDGDGAVQGLRGVIVDEAIGKLLRKYAT
jgi:hypothetical protein